MSALPSFLVDAILLGTALTVLALDLVRGPQAVREPLYTTAFAGTGFAAFLVFLVPAAVTGTGFAGFLVSDPFALWGKGVILLATLFALAMTVSHLRKGGDRYAAEFVAVLLFASAGATTLASSREFLTLYVGLETLTMSSYLLASFNKRDALSGEAGLKYLLLGAFSSALMLLGVSYLYGLTGTTVISDIALRLRTIPMGPLSVLSVVLVVSGLGFKIALVPFHMWAPDVYEGAPTPVTAYLSVASKTAGFLAFARIFMEGFSAPSLVPVWTGLFAVLAVLTMVVGNLGALPQTRLKRLMAYSSIAQAGYLILGILTRDRLGLTALLYYLFLYVFTNFGVFLSIQYVSQDTGTDLIEDYAGMSRRQPLIAATLLVCLLSLAGVPPLAGFTGKWYLFSAAVGEGYVALVLVGIVFSVVSLYYYLQVVRRAYMTEPKVSAPIRLSWSEKTLLATCLVMTVVLGAFPGPFLRLAEEAAAAFPLLP